MKILVVEDDPVSLKLVTSILKKNQFEVTQVESAKEAKTFLQEEGLIDLIISDIVMPEISGLHLLKYLKTEKRLRFIPVILCTALSDKESVAKGIELGAADYIVKPVNADVLIAKVKKAFDRLPGQVLVVDDEELLRRLLFQTLGRQGYRILLASSGNEALELMEKNKVAVVLSDIEMPGMNGLELLVTIKDKHPHVPVLLMTGHGATYGRQDVISAGADGYITKPFKNTDIINKIEPFLR